MTAPDPDASPHAVKGQIRPSSLVDALYSDNGKWAFIYVAIASAAATFVLAGKLGWEFGAAVIVILIITALCVTTAREMQARKAAEDKADQYQQMPAADKASPEAESTAASAQEPASGGEAASTSHGAESTSTKKEDAAPIGSPSESPASKPDDDHAKDHDDDPHARALRAAFDHDPEGVDAALKGYIDEAASDPEKAERESQRIYYAVIAGRSAAVNELRTLADNYPADSKILAHLAYALENIGEARQAADELQSRRNDLVEGQVSIAVLEARLRLSLGEPQAALDLARDGLQQTLDPNDRADALIQE